MNVMTYVNGKRVTMDEIKNIEIQKESAKRVLSQVLSGQPKAIDGKSKKTY